jgi:hypothetical protein
VTITSDNIAERYVRLGLALEAHLPGYVDAYYGPPAWRSEIEAAGPRPVAELAGEADDLARAIAAAELDAGRRDFLARQVRAMECSLAALGGEPFSLAEEAERLYDITPAWTDEATFGEAHRALAELLPPGDSLAERMAARRKALEIPVAQVQALLGEITTALRRRTQARFPLPEDESFEVHFVKDQPWGGYNWYLGGCRSRIDINTDLPLRIAHLTGLLAHEGYPGHHTELANKEMRLARGRGWIEHTIALINSPSCVIAEGIATRALEVLMDEDARIAWQAELFRRAGYAHLDARREHAIDEATRGLEGISGNAAFLLHDRGGRGVHDGDDEVVAYIQHWRLATVEEARKTLSFLKAPRNRSYIFTYHYGGALLDALFAAKRDRDAWFTRLLTEPVTPGQIRAWIAGQAEIGTMRGDQ